MNKSSRYKEQALKYFHDVEELMEEGDYLQASEKLWGVAASYVKAVAEQKGINHNGHAQLFNVINSIAEEMDDKDLRRFFSSASTLHTNFYENWLPPEYIIEAKEDVQKLLNKLEKVLKE